jgi:hypothetical protein
LKRSRLWTEDELVLLLWALPLMRGIARITGREFSAIAMKLANLLAVETGGKQGLANFSALDRAIVERYLHDRDGLEARAIQLLTSGRPEKERAAEIRESAVDVVRRHGAPLHVDVIAAILAARDITLVATSTTIHRALSGHPMIRAAGKDVFAWTSRTAK